MSRGKSVLVLAAIAGVLLMAGAETLAKKPVKPPPSTDTGIIYYWQGGALHTMDPDGSDKTSLGLSGAPEVPSRGLHDGKRWFLVVKEIADESYPSGDARHEIFAITASGDEVQLTDDAAVEPMMPDGDKFRVMPQWGVDSGAEDGKVSYVARHWDDSDEVDDVGLFVAQIDLDDLDNHSPVEPEYFAVPTHVYDDPFGGYGPFATIPHAWSPDGTQLVYLRAGETSWVGLWRLDSDGTDALELTKKAGHCASWSPDGGRILCLLRGDSDWDIVTMDPDGSDLTTVISDPGDKKNTTVYFDDGLCWSPSGTHIVYRVATFNSIKGTTKSDVYSATVDGDDETNLTGDTDAGVGPVAWLASE